MSNPHKKGSSLLPVFTALIFLLFLGIILVVGLCYDDGQESAFSEKTVRLTDNWTLTDSRGVQKQITLPYVLDYGMDGAYTLETVVPQETELIATPALEFYSNYIDFTLFVDGVQKLSFPAVQQNAFVGTGNTWHYLRLSSAHTQRLQITLQCQLGSGITYLLEAPQLGSKATMLHEIYKQNIPAVILASLMLLLALGLTVLCLVLRKQLRLGSSPLHLAAFALLFGLYVFLETGIAKHCGLNSYLLYVFTLLLLALMATPLINLFAASLDKKFKWIPKTLVVINLASFFIQALLHFTQISNLRVLLPVTHVVIVFSMAVMVTALLLSRGSGRHEGHKTLLTAVPMVVGGIADILLLWNNAPSFNNSFWFVLGVSGFILLQFVSAVRLCFHAFKLAVESEYLRDMAYRDILTGLENRNAYEAQLVRLSGNCADGLGCIIADINGLKSINDTYGHNQGDHAIREAGQLILQLLPKNGKAYRTGGDEFILLMEGVRDSKLVYGMAATLQSRFKHRGEELKLPLTLSVGWGVYLPEDSSLPEFLSRVDTLMYQNKRTTKIDG